MESSKKKFPQRGEIHWVDYNYKTQQGAEIKKTRPSLVISNNAQNEFDKQIIVVPLSTEDINQVEDFEVFIDKAPKNGLEKPSKILCNRLQTIDMAIRLKGFMGATNPEIMDQVSKALKIVLVIY